MKLIKLDQTYKNQLFNMMEEWLPINKIFNIFLYDEKNGKLIGAVNIQHSFDERLLRNMMTKFIKDIGLIFMKF
ncbi:hypothetical protein [Acholeplasma equifetale]|uniref:hypothetical protein n=1 Tax=Acholeplasma equifetale TaxID=264634 RepID=UPI00047CA228|nr:hypothetical protein [Acholeplasma equifetale]